MAVVQFVFFLSGLSTITIMLIDRPYWFKVKIGFVPAFITFTLAAAQFYFAWVAWRSHFFNKVDFLVNEFLKALMGDLPYRKLMARHRLHRMWLSRYCYCPPTTNLVSEGFPKEICFIQAKTGPDPRAGHTPTEPMVRDTDVELAKVWDNPMDFIMNDIHLTITKFDTDVQGKTSLEIKVRNTLVNEHITLPRILPDTEDYNFMMTLLSKWGKDPDFSFIRYVYKDIYYGHCHDIRVFFDLVGRGNLNFVKVQLPTATRVYVAGVR